MKFSEQWLRCWADPDLSTAELAEQLTMAGLEVETVAAVAGPFTGVVVAAVLEVEDHPDADALKVCRVDDGSGEPLQIVCGAPNVAPGLKVPLARVGAVLPGEFKIRRARLRGVASEGMLCSESELELGEEEGGLLVLAPDAPSGMDLRQWLELDDQAIELDLTPNRADCLSLLGIARELAAINRLPPPESGVEPVAATTDEAMAVSLEAGESCPRYVSRVIRNVNPNRPTPTWLVERLRRSGIRSIDPIVDVTNLVLLERGQPMHAFDRARLQGSIRVRSARSGEQLEVLGGELLRLVEGELVIADDSGPVALAGILGGASTSVSAETRDIVLESAFFAPRPLAGRARHYGLHTDSSHRFERGVDPEGQVHAMERATRLILDIAGGEPGPLVEARLDDCLPARPEVTLRRARIARVLGIELKDEEVEDSLTRLGLTLERIEQGWRARPPSWRFDLAIEEDLLEELARIHGYNRLPLTPLDARIQPPPLREANTPTAAFAAVLVARGYCETISYSFVDPALQALLDPEITPLVVTNPISADLSVMRTTLWTGLLRTALYNSKRQQQRLRIFESGLRFLPGESGLVQQPTLGLLLGGQRDPESWAGRRAAVDFHDLKGDVEALLQRSGVAGECRFVASTHPALHPGQTAQVLRGQQCIGRLGRIHPEVQRKLGLSQPVFLAELELAGLGEAPLPRYQPLSRFPEVRRDLALLAPRELPAQVVLDAVREAAGALLKELRLFDLYEGDGIDIQRKSLALGLTFRHSSRTLVDDEVNEAVDAVVRHLASEHQVTLRN